MKGTERETASDRSAGGKFSALVLAICRGLLSGVGRAALGSGLRQPGPWRNRYALALQARGQGFESSWLHYLTLSAALSPPEETAKYPSTAAVPAGGDAQWPSSRSPSAFNALKVESLVTWLYTSIVTAIWLWRSICMATRGWTSRATSRDAQALRVACTSS